MLNILIMKHTFSHGAAVAQAAQCLTTGWTIGVRSPTGVEDFSSSSCVQNRIWGPPSLLSNGYRGSFPRG
jgi:hypothetical protein